MKPSLSTAKLGLSTAKSAEPLKEFENEIPAFITRIVESLGVIEYRLDELAVKLADVLSPSPDTEPEKCEEEETETVIGNRLQNIANRTGRLERSIQELINRLAL